jgi:hypothetical protein
MDLFPNEQNFDLDESRQKSQCRILKKGTNFPCVIAVMTEKRQTSQGYIIRILQHFATKLPNITNFVILASSCGEMFV